MFINKVGKEISERKGFPLQLTTFKHALFSLTNSVEDNQLYQFKETNSQATYNILVR
jgi:hypothetical protein